MSIFSVLPTAPRDPILGLTETFNADPSPDKVNLGVGIYLNNSGKLPLMACVAAVEQDLPGLARPRGYLPMDGMPAYNQAAQELAFGANSPARLAGRVVTLQSLGGTGALRVGAGLLGLSAPGAPLLLSTPSWENHELLFSRAGFAIGSYRYYDAATRSVDVGGMIDDLSRARPGSIVVLHACCHNPTGYDLTPADWAQVVAAVAERGLVPFLDMAYQGFSTSTETDRAPVEAFVASGVPFVVAQSFSKSFGLYGERIGAVHFVAADADEAARLLSQAKLVVRSLYSNPPTHGAAIVSTVLTTPELKALWDQELAEMRERIKTMRVAFRAGLEQAGVAWDVSFITDQAGLFSYSGLTVAQMQRLRDEFHVYGLDSGRLNVAALNPGNLDRVVASVAAVMAS